MTIFLTIILFPLLSMAGNYESGEHEDQVCSNQKSLQVLSETQHQFEQCNLDTAAAGSCLKSFWDGATSDIKLVGSLIDSAYEKVDSLYKKSKDYIYNTTTEQKCKNFKTVCLNTMFMVTCPVGYLSIKASQDEQFLKFAALVNEFSTNSTYRKQVLSQLQTVIDSKYQQLNDLPQRIEDYFSLIGQLQIHESAVLNFACSFAGEAGFDVLVSLLSMGAGAATKSAKIHKYIDRLVKLSNKIANDNIILREANKLVGKKSKNGSLIGKIDDEEFSLSCM